MSAFFKQPDRGQRSDMPAIIFQRFWVIALCLVAAVVIAVYSVLSSDSEYAAVATLRVATEDAVAAADARDAYLAAVENPVLASSVLNRLTAEEHGQLLALLNDTPEVPMSDAALAQRLVQRVAANPETDSLFTISSAAANPGAAVAMTNRYAETLIELSTASGEKLDAESRSWWNAQIEALQEKSNKLQERLDEIGFGMGPPDVMARSAQELKEPAKRYVDARVRYFTQKEELALASKALGENQNPAVLVAGNKPPSEAIAALEAAVAESKARQKRLGKALQIVEMRISATESNVLRQAEYAGRSLALEHMAVNIAGRLSGDLLFESEPPGALEIVSPARASQADKSSNWRRALGIALLLGTLTGVLLVFLLELRRSRGEDWRVRLEQETGRPVVGRLLSRFTDAESLRRCLTQADTANAGPLQSLCRKLDSVPVKDKSLVLLVTSLGQPGHRTWLATDMAAVLSRRGKTLLVDIDMEQPGLNALGRSEGLTDFLGGKVNSSDFLARYDAAPDLRIMASGTTRIATDDFAASSALADFLVQARQRFDSVVLHGATLDSGWLSPALLERVDATVVTVDPLDTAPSEVATALDRLDGSGERFLGLVICDANNERSRVRGKFNADAVESF